MIHQPLSDVGDLPEVNSRGYYRISGHESAQAGCFGAVKNSEVTISYRQGGSSGM